MLTSRQEIHLAAGARSRAIRWWRDPRLQARWRAGRRRRLGLVLIAFTIAVVTVPVLRWRLEPPRREPQFEGIVDDAPGPVKVFALADIRGQSHTLAEWIDRPGILLIFLSTQCPATEASAAEIARLAGEFAGRGIAFYGIHSDPEVSAEMAANHAAAHGLRFPILLDPDQTMARQLGASVTPEAFLVAADGQVLYHGRIDDLFSSDGRRQTRAQTHDLESALEAVVANELPVSRGVPAYGTRLPPPRVRQGNDKSITFTRHVAPILWSNCARCHRPGAVAPFPLLTYHDAARRADFICDVVASGQMPPWKPHSGAGVFQEAARLSPVEKEILRAWAVNGRIHGDPADLPPMPKFQDGWQLGEPDVVITMPEPFTVPATGRDVYQAFAVPLDLGRDIVINGLEFHPGNSRVVHHSRLYLDATGDARRRDLADPAPGFSGPRQSQGIGELPYPGLGGWSPGMTARFAPDGVGRLIRDRTDLVFSIHYHTNGKRELDQSRVGLFIARKPTTRKMVGFTLCTDRIDIPAGAQRHKMVLSAWVKADVHLYTVVPHAHYLCREFRLEATLPDGTREPLLWIQDWDLDWQDQYRYLKPVRLPRGTLLTLAAYFDNSDGNPRNPHNPPKRVRYGLGTDDEMCACHLEMLPDNPAGYAAYPDKSPFGL